METVTITKNLLRNVMEPIDGSHLDGRRELTLGNCKAITVVLSMEPAMNLLPSRLDVTLVRALERSWQPNAAKALDFLEARKDIYYNRNR